MYEHDVIVVGAGGAGLRAAIAAHEEGADVAIVSKLHPVRSHTGAAEGGINAALREGDSWEDHAYDTMKGSDYLADAPAAETLCKDSPKETIKLEHWGMAFSRDDDGRVSQRPFGGLSFPRPPTRARRRATSCSTRCTSSSSSAASRCTTSGT